MEVEAKAHHPRLFLLAPWRRVCPSMPRPWMLLPQHVPAHSVSRKFLSLTKPLPVIVEACDREPEITTSHTERMYNHFSCTQIERRQISSEQIQHLHQEIGSYIIRISVLVLHHKSSDPRALEVLGKANRHSTPRVKPGGPALSPRSRSTAASLSKFHQ